MLFKEFSCLVLLLFLKLLFERDHLQVVGIIDVLKIFFQTFQLVFFLFNFIDSIVQLGFEHFTDTILHTHNQRRAATSLLKLLDILLFEHLDTCIVLSLKMGAKLCKLIRTLSVIILLFLGALSIDLCFISSLRLFALFNLCRLLLLLSSDFLLLVRLVADLMKKGQRGRIVYTLSPEYSMLSLGHLKKATVVPSRIRWVFCNSILKFLLYFSFSLLFLFLLKSLLFRIL